MKTQSIIVIIGVMSMIYIFWQAVTVIGPHIGRFIDPSYTDAVYRGDQQAYDHSQYRVKNHPSIIPDETVFSYASGAYARGVDPILINSEITPLAKYILGLSILLIKNDAFPILIAGVVVLSTVYFLSKTLIRNSWISIVPVALLSADVLFKNQFVIVPLLDIMQLPFILLSLYAFIREYPRRKWFPWTGVLLGCVAAAKHPAAGVLLGIVFFIIFTWDKVPVSLYVRFAVSMIGGLIVYLLNYIRTFMDGYTIAQFIGFQKWIIRYQQSKLEYPFSSWRLLLFNQWQAWWGSRAVLHANDWSWLWPLSVAALLMATYVAYRRKDWQTVPFRVLWVWSVIYLAFLSVGVVSSRFFLPYLPIGYIFIIYCISSFLPSL